MTLTDQIAYGSLAVAAISLLVAVLALLQVRKARKQLVIFRGTGNEVDFLETASALSARNEELNSKIQRLAHLLMIAQRDVSEALRHVAVVRFNAVQDMGGQFSFSAALLDDGGTGVVITSIQAHNQGRVYAKFINEGDSEHPLTPEEKQAIAAARAQKSE